MRYALALILLLGASASADDPFKSGDDLQQAIKDKCAGGCIVMSREDAADLEERLGQVLGTRMQEAFDAGAQQQKAACLSLI